MKKLLSIFTAVMLLCAITSCNTEADKTELSDVQAPEMTAEIMEQLIDDMLVGTCVPKKYKAMLGDECIKDWDDPIISSSGVKYGSGLGNPIVLYNDGSCRIGYNSALYSVCPLTQIDLYDHPEYLYDTWFWECDLQQATITFTSKLTEQQIFVHTVKVISYIDGELIIEGCIPNVFSKETLTYKCKVKSAFWREEFELKYFDEEDYPCCAQ